MPALTLPEAYFLVRVGSWGEAELEAWVQQRIEDEYSEDVEELYENDWEDHIGDEEC